MSKPIPLAIVSQMVGEGTSQPLLMLVGIASHLAYCGVWGGILASITWPVTMWKGIGVGAFLWLLMQIIVLPFLGWGFFGTAGTATIAVATLILHLIYGGTYGALMDRHPMAVASA